jgi:hypothetical protein
LDFIGCAEYLAAVPEGWQKALSCATPFVRCDDLRWIMAFFQASVVIGLKQADLIFHGLSNAVT